MHHVSGPKRSSACKNVNPTMLRVYFINLASLFSVISRRTLDAVALTGTERGRRPFERITQTFRSQSTSLRKLEDDLVAVEDLLASKSTNGAILHLLES